MPRNFFAHKDLKIIREIGFFIGILRDMPKRSKNVQLDNRMAR